MKTLVKIFFLLPFALFLASCTASKSISDLNIQAVAIEPDGIVGYVAFDELSVDLQETVSRYGYKSGDNIPSKVTSNSLHILKFPNTDLFSEKKYWIYIAP